MPFDNDFIESQNGLCMRKFSDKSLPGQARDLIFGLW